MPERLTRLFSSADDSSGSSDTSDSSSELWARSPAGRFSLPDYGNRDGGEESPSKLALPGLVAALRASRARSSAAQAKASRLLEETQRLRKALKVARKGEERAERIEKDLAKSEDRVRELESDNGCLRRDLEGARLRTRKTEEKARHSLSTLRAALENLERDERSQRALLESLRRHVQRGHHSSPSFTAFQLMEQIFECLKSQESEASLPSPSPRHRKPGPRPRPSSSSPGFPLSPASSSRLSLPAADPRTEVSPGRRRPHRNADGDDDFGRVLELNGVRTGQAARGRRREGREGEGLLPAETGDGGDGGGDGGACFFFSGSEAGSSEEDFRLQGGGGEPAAAGGGVGRQGETAAGFSTEWAYRLAVTKLTAQLKAARERLRGEKEASRLAGERAEQEELRCRQLELEVEGLSAKVAAADSHRRRLEESLREAKRERDVLKRRQHSTAATHALNAALGILHQRRMPPSSGYTPVATAAAPSPPPPPPTPPPPHQPSSSPAGAAAAVAAAEKYGPTRAAAVQEATANEALYYGGGDGGRLEPSTLTPAYSGGGESGGGGWWDGNDERREDDDFAYTQKHQRQHRQHAPSQTRAADARGNSVPEASASGAAHYPPRGGGVADPPLSPSLLDTPPAAWSATHDRGGDGGGGGVVSRGGDIGIGSGAYDARSQIQRIVDDAVRNGTRGRDGDPAESTGLAPASARFRSSYRRRRHPDPDPDRDPGGGDPLFFRGIGGGGGGGGTKPGTASEAATARARVYSGGGAGPGSRLATRAYEDGGVPTSAPGSGRPGGFSVAANRAFFSRKTGDGAGGGGGGGSGGGVSSRAGSSWTQLGPRAVTREDLTRLDDEIANLSKTVEQAAMAQTRQKLRDVTG